MAETCVAMESRKLPHPSKSDHFPGSAHMGNGPAEENTSNFK